MDLEFADQITSGSFPPYSATFCVDKAILFSMENVKQLKSCHWNLRASAVGSFTQVFMWGLLCQCFASALLSKQGIAGVL